MDKNIRSPLCTLLILGVLIIIRVVSLRISEQWELIIMASINGLAINITFADILNETISLMKKEHKEIGKDKKNFIPENSRIRDFKKVANYIKVLLIILTFLYLALLKGDILINDLITIIALVLSINKTELIKSIKKKFYQYY